MRKNLILHASRIDKAISFS